MLKIARDLDHELDAKTLTGGDTSHHGTANKQVNSKY